MGRKEERRQLQRKPRNTNIRLGCELGALGQGRGNRTERGRGGEIYSRQNISEALLFFSWESQLHVNLKTYVLINVY